MAARVISSGRWLVASGQRNVRFDDDVVAGDFEDFDFGIACDEGAVADDVEQMVAEAGFSGGAEIGGSFSDGAGEDGFFGGAVGGVAEPRRRLKLPEAGASWRRRKPGVVKIAAEKRKGCECRERAENDNHHSREWGASYWRRKIRRRVPRVRSWR